MRDFRKDEVWHLISEGCGRNTDTEFARFIHIATGAANETACLIQLSFDLKYLNHEFYICLTEKINLIKKKLYHLNKTLQTKS